MSVSMMVVISLYLFVVGSIFASFATLIGERIPRGISIVTPGSHCFACKHRLHAFELIPIVSWIVLRGQCRYCKVKISPLYPLLEFGLAAILVVSFIQNVNHMWICLVNGTLWFVMMIAITTDMNSLRVPNWLTLPAGGLCLILSLISGHSLMMTIGGMLIGFGVIFIIHLLSRGGIGLGDAKLYLPIGATLGPGLTVESFVFACAYGAFIGSVMRVFGKLKKRQPIPFVPWIALGVATAQFVLPHLWHQYVAMLIR